MAEKQKIPTVEVLKAIEPTAASVRGDILRYALLDEKASLHATHETARLQKFFETVDDSLDEESAGRQMALQYFLMTAQKLNQAATADSKQLWSERFTQATSELYGTPEAGTAHQLGTMASRELITQAHGTVDSELIGRFEQLTQEYQLDDSLEDGEKLDFSEAASEVRNYLRETYTDVFDALGYEDLEGRVSASEFADRAERALAVLASNHGEAWADVVVERAQGVSKLSASTNKLIVGENRVPMLPAEAEGLFAHEVLVHIQRRLKGKEISPELAKGLSGYLDAEEGLGTFEEYAITGELPVKNVDRYVDIALALGIIDGKPKTRDEMIEYAGTRALIRNELLPEDEQETTDKVMDAVYAHINRIYRGSLGNEYVGVYTKDIAYQKGFIVIGEFIQNALANGQSIREVMEYLMQGKFDPTNERHVAELERLKHEKES